jgi:hypothetical protein
VENGLIRPQHSLYLAMGFGLSLMVSFALVISFFPIINPVALESVEEVVLPQTQLHPSDAFQEVESIVSPTPAPLTGKLSSIVSEPEPKAADTPQDSVHLLFGGDVNEGRWGDNPDWHVPLVDSFVNLLPLMQGMDLVFFNAEGGLCDPVEAGFDLKPRGSNILWVTPASLIGLQTELGETALAIDQANNHTMNLGEACMRHGIKTLSDAGISVLGAGKDLSTARAPYVLELDGTVIGILAYADTNVIIDAWVADSDHAGVMPMDAEVFKEDMEKLRPAVDFLIVTFHSGKEFERAVTENQVQFALAAVQYGADLVIGHGAHVPQGVLQIEDTPIFFGLGNGMMDQCFPDDYAFYTNDVRKNVWLEVEIRKTELISVHDHVFYSAKCMVPSIATSAIQAEVIYAFENILFMEDFPVLSNLATDDLGSEDAADNLVD